MPEAGDAGMMESVETEPADPGTRPIHRADGAWSGPTRVGVVHASPLVRQALGDLLNRQPGIEVVGLLRSAAELLDGPPSADHVLLYDYLTAREDGVHLLMGIRQRVPLARLLIFEVFDAQQAIVECVRFGAVGCLLRGATVDDVCAAIHNLAHGIPPVSPGVVTSLLRYVAGLADGTERPRVAGLTPREQEIMQLVAEGLANKEIAKKLIIQPQTVRNYLHLIFQKLDVHSRRDAVHRFRIDRPPRHEGTLQAS